MEREDEPEEQESTKQESEHPANYYVWSSTGNKSEDDYDNKDDAWGPGTPKMKVLLRMRKKYRKIKITYSKKKLMHIITIYVQQVVLFIHSFINAMYIFMCIFPALTTYPPIKKEKKKKRKNEQTQHKNNCICGKFLFSILYLTEAKKNQCM